MAENPTFFIEVCYRWPQKNDPHQFLDFFENFYVPEVLNVHVNEIKKIYSFYKDFF